MEEKQWFRKTIEEITSKFEVNIEQGLTKEQVIKNRQIYGKNELEQKKKKSIIIKFLEQFKDFMIVILIIAAIISGVIGYIEGEGITDYCFNNCSSCIWNCWNTARRRNSRYTYYLNSSYCKCYYRCSTRKQSRKIFRGTSKTK